MRTRRALPAGCPVVGCIVDMVFLKQLGVALGLGLLLGLERERAGSSIAGIRTFPFIALLGTVTAELSRSTGGWILGAGFITLGAVLVFANLAKIRAGEIDPGITTESAALLLYAVGALLVLGDLTIGVVVGGAMAVLLHLKRPLHKFAAAVGETDMRAMMQFVLITMVILPVLPRQAYGPYDVWNPFKIWLMVVLIVAISLGGYLAYKFFGARAGTLLGGIIGGLISSTATTVSFARRTAADAGLAPLGALVIVTASCVSLGRVVVEIAAVAPRAFGGLAPPVLTLLAIACVVAGGLFKFSSRAKPHFPVQKNPAEFKSALVFGGLYAFVLLAVAFAKDQFGSAGLYVVGAISGMTDMDAITLSSAQLAGNGSIPHSTAWRIILVAALSNLAFKFGTVAFLAPPALAKRVGGAFAIITVAGLLILWLWPDGTPVPVPPP